MRRGSNVAIRIPVFKDKETKPIPVTPAPPIIMKTEETSDEGVKEVKDPKKEMPDIALEDFGNGYEVHMDAMAFGMGCNCLQCTFQVSFFFGGEGGVSPFTFIIFLNFFLKTISLWFDD